MRKSVLGWVAIAAISAGCVALAAETARADWSTRLERPTPRGQWFYTGDINRTVNFLYPRGERHLYQKPLPWTPTWFAYCAARWDSFNPNTGTIVTPDGVRMCI